MYKTIAAPVNKEYAIFIDETNDLSLAHEWGKEDGNELLPSRGAVFFGLFTPAWAAYNEAYIASVRAQLPTLHGSARELAFKFYSSSIELAKLIEEERETGLPLNLGD